MDSSIAETEFLNACPQCPRCREHQFALHKPTRATLADVGSLDFGTCGNSVFPTCTCEIEGYSRLLRLALKYTNDTNTLGI